MKKILYIALLLFGMVAVSCEKQVFVPTNGAQEVPEWTEEKGRSVEDGTDIDIEDGSGDIVDPESDEDGKKKKGSQT
ncbi:MAG: hypothetical protein QNK23_14580 [Crocinitomicaceae bacterium]|nr:hypothetical protein [Crocinitomicaceae bacterium]